MGGFGIQRLGRDAERVEERRLVRREALKELTVLSQELGLQTDDAEGCVDMCYYEKSINLL